MGISALENWMEGKSEDEEGNLVHDMRRLGYQSTFDEVFYRTLSKLHELELDKVDDEQELLAHLPSWGTAEENPDVDVHVVLVSYSNSGTVCRASCLRGFRSGFKTKIKTVLKTKVKTGLKTALKPLL
jgi:hypothetical protein